MASVKEVDYACAVERRQKPQGYSTAWWLCMAAILAAFVLVMYAQA